MNATYVRARATAIRLIKKNGAQFQWRRETQGAFDPVTETDTAPVVLEQLVWAVILPPGNDPDKYKSSDGSVDLSKVRKVIVAPGSEFNPAPLDRVFYAGEWWTYENSSEVNPDDKLDILFKGLIRRS